MTHNINRQKHEGSAPSAVKHHGLTASAEAGSVLSSKQTEHCFKMQGSPKYKNTGRMDFCIFLTYKRRKGSDTVENMPAKSDQNENICLIFTLTLYQFRSYK